LTEKEKTITTLNQTVTNLTQTTNEQKTTISNQTDQIEKLQTQLTTIRTQAEEDQNQIRELNNTVNKQAKTINEQEENIRKMNATMAKLQADIQAIWAYIRDSTRTLNEIDFSLHLEDFNSNTIPLMQELNVQWVRFDWEQGWNNMTYYMKQFSDNNIKILCIIDNRSIGNFRIETWNQSVTKILNDPATEYVSAWEIWNEPNKDPNLNASLYYQALKSAYTIIKNQYPAQQVISSGLAHIGYDDTQFLRELYNYSDTKQYLDIQGAHPYNNNAQLNFEYLNQNVTSIVGNVTIWLTETGTYSSEPYNETFQADYTTENWSLLHSQVEKIFWYEFKDGRNANPESENHFGAIRTDDTKKPVFYTLQGISAA
jgi:hypothetical protein